MVACKGLIYLYQQAENVLPKRSTGNRQSAREVHGIVLVNLALFCLFGRMFTTETRPTDRIRHPNSIALSSGLVVGKKWHLPLRTRHTALRPSAGVGNTRESRTRPGGFKSTVTGQETGESDEAAEGRCSGKKQKGRGESLFVDGNF
ncbi:hypothetical protein ACHAWF_003117 [Thalassiosira exigua]